MQQTGEILLHFSAEKNSKYFSSLLTIRVIRKLDDLALPALPPSGVFF